MSVMTEAGEIVARAPVAGGVNTIVAATGFPAPSSNCTVRPEANASPAPADWPSPAVTVSVLAPRLLSVKSAGEPTPGAVAETTYVPTVEPEVAVMLASPLTSVSAVADESAAVAPLAGAVKVTVTPGTALPNASATATTSGRANAVAGLAGVDWGVPLTA